MASVGVQAYNGGSGLYPQRGPGALPLVRGVRTQGDEVPLELMVFLRL
jgi:hypothetical protein